jgi:RNA polymerase sigma-70 factor (ECF subfamily)
MSSDRKLINQAKKGDFVAFEQLYYRYRDWTYRLARRFTNDHETALDVIQETFTYLLRKLPTLELTASMTTFLYPVVKHICLNIKRKNRDSSVKMEFFADLPAPKEHAMSSRNELAEVLSSLEEDYREILLMRFVDDMSFEEISRALELSLSTVKSRLYRSLEKLRDDPRTKEYFQM